MMNHYLEREPKSILDVGCRTGDFLMHFDENVIREGVELAEEYAKIGSKRGFIKMVDFDNETTITVDRSKIITVLILQRHSYTIDSIEKLDRLKLGGSNPPTSIARASIRALFNQIKGTIKKYNNENTSIYTFFDTPFIDWIFSRYRLASW